MSNIFKLNKRLGFTPPIQFESNTKKSFFQTGFVELDKLVPKLKRGSFTLLWSQFLTSQITKINTKNTKLESYFFNPKSKKPSDLHFIHNAVDKPYIDGNDQYYYKTIISTAKKTISTRRVEFSYNISINDNYYKFRILFPFNDYKIDDNLSNKYGIIIESNYFDELAILLRDLNLGFPLSLKTEITQVFNRAFDNSKLTDSKTFDFLYQHAPSFVIEQREKEILIANVRSILRKPVNQSGTNEELAVINIIKALYKKSGSNDDFLTLLVYKFGPDRVPLYQILYRLDGQYLAHFCEFIQEVWKKSLYKSTKNKVYKDSNCPYILPYRSDKTLGFYHSNIDISFEKGKTIDLTHDTGEIDKEKSSINTFLPIVETKKVLYQCHQYFPIKVPSGQKGEIEISNNVPAFMLYVKENSDFWNNVYTGIGLGIDVLTTLSGFGNVSKFRHLSKLAQRASRLRFAQSAATAARTASNIKKLAAYVEMSSGSINALLKLSELDNSKLGKNLSMFLFYLELLSLGGELTNLIDQGLRKQAKKVLKDKKNLKTKLEKIKKETKEKVKQNDENLEAVEGSSDDLTLQDLQDADDIIREIENIADNVTKGSWRLFKRRGSSGNFYSKGSPMLKKYKPGGADYNLEKGVDYLNELERIKHEVFVQGDKIIDANGNLFNTSDSIIKDWVGKKTISNRAIFVMSPRGHLYISKIQEIGKFHHSTFLSGKKVAAAGEIIIEDGVIKLITDKSGHYRPLLETLETNLRKELTSRGYFSAGGFNLKNIIFKSER